MLDDFDILEYAARGGMSVVFKARHRRTGRVCAVKRSRFPEDPAEQRRVRRRLRFARLRLWHPHILPILDGGVDGGDLWLATPWIEEGSLDPESFQDWEQVRTGLDQLLSGLAYAHGRGVVHRDIKPENILVDGSGWQLADFGILRPMNDITASGPQGTPIYAAPEQVLGNWALLRTWTDLYAVGILAWELVTGTPPFTGSIGSVMRQHVGAELPELRPRMAVPPDLEAWLGALLAKAPWERPPYAALARRWLADLEPETLLSTNTLATAAPAAANTTLDLDALDDPPPLAGPLGHPRVVLPLNPLSPRPPDRRPMRLPDEMPQSLRTLLRHRYVHSVEKVWVLLHDTCRRRHPLVMDCPNTPDTRRVLAEVASRLSESAMAFTLSAHPHSTRAFLRFVFTDDPSAAAGIAGQVGVNLDPEWRTSLQDAEPSAVADMLCAVGRDNPLFAVFADDALAAEMRTRSEGAVLLLNPSDSCRDAPFLPTRDETAAILVEQLGFTSEAAWDRATDGLHAVLTELCPDWLRDV